MALRERTVMPRTTPRLPTIRWPSKVKAVVTHWRGMGTGASSVHHGHGFDLDDLARAREQHGLEVLADLAELADDVARADELTVLVERHLPGDEDRLAA